MGKTHSNFSRELREAGTEVSLDSQGPSCFWLKMGRLVLNPQRAGDLQVLLCFLPVTRERYSVLPPTCRAPCAMCSLPRHGCVGLMAPTPWANSSPASHSLQAVGFLGGSAPAFPSLSPWRRLVTFRSPGAQPAGTRPACGRNPALGVTAFLPFLGTLRCSSA